MIFGNCVECGAFPINDDTGLCEFCEDEADHAGELPLDEEEDRLPKRQQTDDLRRALDAVEAFGRNPYEAG